MKRSQSGNQQEPQNDEKSTFEKLEDEVRLTIFNVLYVLLKDEDESPRSAIIEVFLDHI